MVAVAITIATMQTLKKFLPAFLLIGFLPWCSLASASASAAAATGVIDGDTFFSDAPAASQRVDIAETSFAGPSKNKRIAVLQQAQYGGNATLLSGTDHLLFSFENVAWLLRAPLFTPRRAKAPPTSPPRSV